MAAELQVAHASSSVTSASQGQVPPVTVGGEGLGKPTSKRSQDKLLEEKDNIIKQLKANIRANDLTIVELTERLTQPAKVVQHTDQETQCVHSSKDVATQCEFSSLQHENQLDGLRAELKARQQDVKDREEDLMDRSRKLIEACDETEKLRDNVRILSEQNETLLGILKEHSTRVMKMKSDVVNKEKALERANKQIKRLKTSRYQYDMGDRTFIERTTILEQTETSVAPPPPSLYMGPEILQAPPNRIELTEETTVVWEKLDGTLCRLSGTTAVARQSYVFFSKVLTGDVIGYNVEKNEWFTLPRCPQSHFTLAIVDSLVTAVGGEMAFRVTKSVLSFSEDTSPSTGHWGELIPEMKYARKSPAVVTTPHYMIVGGGEVEEGTFSDTVEILEIESHLWLMVPGLLHPGTSLTAVVCGDQLYMLGGFTTASMSRQAYMCSLSQLTRQSASARTLNKTKKVTSDAVWHPIADLPAFHCACVCLGGHLVAIGGCDKDYNASNQLWYYTLNGNAWHKLPNEMPTARRECLAVTVPVEGKVRLLVVGGFASHELMSTETDAVEAATFK